MDDGVVLLVGFQLRDFQRPDGLQGAGERVIDGGPRRRVTPGGADLPEGAEHLGPVEALAGAVVAEAHAVQDATNSGMPRSGKGRRWGFAMTNYDFRSLSPHDFELLCRDLLQEMLGGRLESFTSKYPPAKPGALVVSRSKRLT